MKQIYRWLVRYLSISVLCLGLSSLAHSNVQVIQQHMPEVHKKSEVDFKYLWLDIYKVSLYVPNRHYDPEGAFALRLVYQRSFRAKDIASRSVYEINKQGFEDQNKLAEWERLLVNILPDVEKGDDLIGIKDAKGNAYFYQGSQLLAEVKDSEFSHWFFNIWLGENSSFPKYTKRLLES